MRKTAIRFGVILSTATLGIGFLSGCNNDWQPHIEVTPLDSDKPIPTCVTIEFMEQDSWDHDERNKHAEVYCIKEK